MLWSLKSLKTSQIKPQVVKTHADIQAQKHEGQAIKSASQKFPLVALLKRYLQFHQQIVNFPSEMKGHCYYSLLNYV